MRTSVDLHNYLQLRNIPHEISFIEMPARTTEMAAAALGLRRSEIGKSLLVEADGLPIIAVIPGDRRLDTRKLKQLTGASKVKFVDPDEVVSLTGYVLGSMPPIAHASEMPVYVDIRLLLLQHVYTSGGQIDTVLKVKPQDLVDAVGAQVVDIADDGRV
ncbi:MAG: YbaK/EbsC family protein [Rubrobacteridae bacterium]|nr:YbaK/EbsC family protein [Rubrobacteridae bacterium]